jgi:DUF1680 family protein
VVIVTLANKAFPGQGSAPVSFRAVKIDDDFWTPRLKTIRERTLPLMYEQMKKAGYFEEFWRDWQPGMRPIPYVFWETDLSKWLEAASFSLATQPDPALEALVDEAIAYMVSFQQPDGYLNIWFTQVEPEKRWTNLRDWHELYSAGHLIEAAVAHFAATGKRRLLDAACRYADYIGTVFGTGPGQRRGYCGHQEIELALVKLYRTTGERRYLELSRYFIEERGRQPHYFDIEARERGENPANFGHKTYEYNQSHLPVREQNEVVGHAVREMYLMCAVADLAKEFQDETFFQTCERLWQHLTLKRMYVTGGIGPAARNEGFTADYDLPNLTAYAETCAAIGLVMWGHRLLQLDVDGRYADIMERALYNGVLSGISLDGTAFFYENPLESTGQHHRQGWFSCACCPPNLARLFMSLGQYLYGVSDSDILVHLYVQSSASLEIGSQRVTLHQKTNYPWRGDIELELELAEAAEFGLKLRIPGWCKAASIKVNGEEIPLDVQKGYALVRRRWQNGDKVQLHLDMPVQQVYAHPAVREDAGCVALARGPLVYCLEAADNPLPLNELSLSGQAEFESRFEPDLLGGVTVITGNGYTPDISDWAETLYRTEPPRQNIYPFTAIPYYAWDQRQPGEMRVWLKANS